MGAFLYFMETELQALRAIDLPQGVMFPKGINCKRIENATLTGKGGVLFVDASAEIPASRFLIAEEGQTWAEADGYHVCVWDDWKPSEKDLRRDNVAIGYGAELGNGETWLVPSVLNLEGKNCLPYWYVSEQTKTAGYLLEDAKRMLEHVKSIQVNNESDYQDGDMIEAFSYALSVNYKLGYAEAMLLGLFNTADSCRNAMEVYLGG